MADQAQPATGEPTPSAQATQPEPSAPASQERASGSQATDQATPETPAEDWKAKLTPEQRQELLRDADPDEAIAANDRLQGHVGKLAQRQAAQDRAAYERQQQLVADLNRRQRALADRDPDALHEIVQGDLQGISQSLTEQQRRATAPWDGAVALFTSGLLPEQIVKPLRGKDYGQNADEAAKLFYKDLESGYEKHFRSKLEANLRKELEPVIRKEIRAELTGEEPTPDTGSGGTPSSNGTTTSWRSLSEAQAAIRRMPLREYARREAEIDSALARLSARRGAA